MSLFIARSYGLKVYVGRGNGTLTMQAVIAGLQRLEKLGQPAVVVLDDIHKLPPLTPGDKEWIPELQRLISGEDAIRLLLAEPWGPWMNGHGEMPWLHGLSRPRVVNLPLLAPPEAAILLSTAMTHHVLRQSDVDMLPATAVVAACGGVPSILWTLGREWSATMLPSVLLERAQGLLHHWQEAVELSKLPPNAKLPKAFLAAAKKDAKEKSLSASKAEKGRHSRDSSVSGGEGVPSLEDHQAATHGIYLISAAGNSCGDALIINRSEIQTFSQFLSAVSQHLGGVPPNLLQVTLNGEDIAARWSVDQKQVALGSTIAEIGHHPHQPIQFRCQRTDAPLHLYYADGDTRIGQVSQDAALLAACPVQSIVGGATPTTVPVYCWSDGTLSWETEYVAEVPAQLWHADMVHVAFSNRRIGRFCGLSAVTGISWCKDAPAYCTVQKGLCLEARCSHARCPAFKRTVVVNFGFGQFDMKSIAEMCFCPACGNKTGPVASWAVNNCVWIYDGRMHDGRLRSSSGSTPDLYHTFSADYLQWPELWIRVAVHEKNSS